MRVAVRVQHSCAFIEVLIAYILDNVHATGVTQTGLKLSFNFHSMNIPNNIIPNCKQFNFAFSGTVVNHRSCRGVRYNYTLNNVIEYLKGSTGH